MKGLRIVPVPPELARQHRAFLDYWLEAIKSDGYLASLPANANNVAAFSRSVQKILSQREVAQRAYIESCRESLGLLSLDRSALPAVREDNSRTMGLAPAAEIEASSTPSQEAPTSSTPASAANLEPPSVSSSGPTSANVNIVQALLDGLRNVKIDGRAAPTAVPNPDDLEGFVLRGGGGLASNPLLLPPDAARWKCLPGERSEVVGSQANSRVVDDFTLIDGATHNVAGAGRLQATVEWTEGSNYLEIGTTAPLLVDSNVYSFNGISRGSLGNVYRFYPHSTIRFKSIDIPDVGNGAVFRLPQRARTSVRIYILK